MIRIIVLGPQCSGKTTIARDLRLLNLACDIMDEDEEINRRNGGMSPSNWTGWDYKWTVLRPHIQRDVLSMDNVIFFTSFFDLELLVQAKHKSFTIIQLTARDDVLKERNTRRMEEGVDDATYGWSINLPYHADIRASRVVDGILETDKPVRELSELILVIDTFARLTARSLQVVDKQLA